MLYSTNGLVLRSTDRDDHDKLLTLLTPERGQVTVIAKGAQSMHSKFLSLVQPYTYGNFEIYEKNGSIGWLRGGSSLQPVHGLSTDLDKLSLSAYLAEVALDVTGENVPAVDILRILLNSLFALAEDKRPAWQVKGVFEWRTAAISGFLPDLEGCGVCGSDGGEELYLDVMNGRLICRACLLRQGQAQGRLAYDDTQSERTLLLPVSSAQLSACRYILSVRTERIYAFSLDESEAEGFAHLCENYLLHHLERDFDSLKFYKSLQDGI